MISQINAIDLFDEGSQVILENWLKIHLIDSSDPKYQVEKWQKSINDWFNILSKIRIKKSSKPPSLNQAIKWFFDEGAESKASDIIREIDVIKRDYIISKIANPDALEKLYRVFVVACLKNQMTAF